MASKPRITPKGRASRKHLPAQVGVEELKPYRRNPRRGDLTAIKESLESHGQYRPVVANARTSEVLAGNHTLQAVKELGWKRIDVTWVDVDAEQAARIVAVDNRTTDLATYDSSELADLLRDLDGLQGTGYEEADLDELLAEVDPAPQLGDDEPPPPPPSPRTAVGDIWELGGHRLICSDARDPSAYEALLGSDRPQLLWTDPPYGVDYEGKTAEALKIRGDLPVDLPELLEAAFAAACAALAAGARIYVCHPAGALSRHFIDAFLDAEWHLHQQLVWVKDSLVLGHSDYQFRHESILYGHKPGKGRIGRGGHGWYGGDSETTVLEVSRPIASGEHPTMKPPELIEIALCNSSRRREIVLDPFAGSGSTLVACERHGRRARLIELDPRYCDVIVGRWEGLTGKKAKRRQA